MWSDSEDLAVIADMFQVRIKVITSYGNEGATPTVNLIVPEQSMKQFAELNDVDMEEMVMFHENDCHFNLVVNKESDLATKGNLSRRFNIGPLLVEDYNDEAEVTENKADDVIDANEQLQDTEFETELKKISHGK